jgi:hypothetical protein
VVPGVDVKVKSSDIQNEKEEEWDAFVDCLRLLTSKPNWVDLLLGVWNRIEVEKPQELKR